MPSGGGKKRGGWKTSRTTRLPKEGFGPPPPRTVRFPPRSGVSTLFFLYKIHDRADQKLETQIMVQAKLKPKLRPRQTLYLPGKEKLRPWSKFLGRENSDHGLNFGLPRGGGRSFLDEYHGLNSWPYPPPLPKNLPT